MTEWFENEELWRVFGDCMFDEARFTAAADELDDLLALYDGVPETVLDLGCGPGRHAVPLAQRGMRVTGLDLSGYLLGRAAERAAAAGVELEWLSEDMRKFTRPGGFDLIISMWTSFGYFDDPADDALVLHRCYENLAAGGALIIDTAGKEYALRHIEPVHLTEYDDGSILLERPVLENQMTRYANQWTLLRDGRYHQVEWHHNLYSGQELSDRLRAAGFGSVTLYGGVDGTEFDLDAERLVAVARKDSVAGAK